MANPSALPKTIAGVRMATSVFFLLFGEYELAAPGFAHGGFSGLPARLHHKQLRVPGPSNVIIIIICNRILIGKGSAYE
jgi:hypothetical protein